MKDIVIKRIIDSTQFTAHHFCRLNKNLNRKYKLKKPICNFDTTFKLIENMIKSPENWIYDDTLGINGEDVNKRYIVFFKYPTENVLKFKYRELYEMNKEIYIYLIAIITITYLEKIY